MEGQEFHTKPSEFTLDTADFVRYVAMFNAVDVVAKPFGGKTHNERRVSGR
jgi:hypothetical protein